MSATYFFFQRTGENEGVTVSKKDTLPGGDFGITEYVFQRFGNLTLWFIDGDGFTADERERACQHFLDAVAKVKL